MITFPVEYSVILSFVSALKTFFGTICQNCPVHRWK
jgi:hypothetical protein